MTKSYLKLIKDLKENIISSQYKALSAANLEQLSLYFNIGRRLSEKTAGQKWRDQAFEKVAIDLQKELPGLRGFSCRHLKNMQQFFEAYYGLPIWQSTTAKLSTPFFKISFTHHLLILNKCKHLGERWFYIEHAATELWSATILEHQIEGDLYGKQQQTTS